MTKQTEFILETYLEDNIHMQINTDNLDDTLEEITIEAIVDQLSENELRQLIINGTKHFTIHDYTVTGIVKKAIDNFDPYAIGPLAGGPYDEYEPEIEDIAERLSFGMTVEEIRRIIEAIFIYYFEASFPSESYERPAYEIHRHLDDVIIAAAKTEMENDQ